MNVNGSESITVREIGNFQNCFPLRKREKEVWKKEEVEKERLNEILRGEREKEGEERGERVKEKKKERERG